MALLLGCGASQESKTINPKKENGATISLKSENNGDSVRAFPKIPSTLFLTAREVSSTQGSFSSINVLCTDTIEDAVYSLSIFLPAGKKFGMGHKPKGGIEFITDPLPCTIAGNEYQPFKNALTEESIEVQAVFEVRDTKNKTYDYLIFSLEKLTIYSMEESDSKFSAHFDFDGSSGKHSQPAYGLYSAHIEIEVEKMNLDLMMVD
jgi:hypothetical protein